MVRKSKFIMFSNRLKLLYKLKEKNFYVRMHAYEYIVGTGDKMVAIILLEPNKNSVDILKLKRSKGWEIKEIISTIKSLDPCVKIKTKSL